MIFIISMFKQGEKTYIYVSFPSRFPRSPPQVLRVPLMEEFAGWLYAGHGVVICHLCVTRMGNFVQGWGGRWPQLSSSIWHRILRRYPASKIKTLLFVVFLLNITCEWQIIKLILWLETRTVLNSFMHSASHGWLFL